MVSSVNLPTHAQRDRCCCSRQQEAGLPLWLRPYEVLVTSNRTSLIELVPNTLSIHAVKAKSPANTSLRAHFIARYGAVCPRRCDLHFV